MPYLVQMIVILISGAILIRFLKPYLLRKWLGLTLLMTGLIGFFKVGRQQVLGFDLELLMLLAIQLGGLLFATRRRFTEED